MTRARKIKASVVAAAAAAVLTACGVHPGAAAVVGDQTITDSQVDQVAAALCSASAGGGGQDLASRGARQGALQVMLDSELSRQFGESKGVQPDQRMVSQALAQNQNEIDNLPAGERDAFRQALKQYAEGQLMLVQIGRQYLASQGQTAADDNQAIAAGRKLRDQYAKKINVQVDPRYGTYDNAKGTLTASSGSLSVAASSRAVDGGSPDPSQSWVAALPASQKCQSPR